MTDWVPTVWVVGPYVVVDKARNPPDAVATVVDTRSGAVTDLPERVTAADGGTIALVVQSGGKDAPYFPHVVRTDTLSP